MTSAATQFLMVRGRYPGNATLPTRDPGHCEPCIMQTRRFAKRFLENWHCELFPEKLTMPAANQKNSGDLLIATTTI